MNWGLSLTILGTIVTITGTGITIVQAKRVHKYREEIRVDRLKIFLIDSIIASESIKKASSNLRTPVNKEFARGFDMQVNVSKIENYLCTIEELALRFELVEIEKKHDELEKLITNYKRADGELKFSVGDDMDRKINGLIIRMKQLALD